MGTGKIGTSEVDSPGERPSVEEKVKKEPRLQLRFLTETTLLRPHQPAPQREVGREAGFERRGDVQRWLQSTCQTL